MLQKTIKPTLMISDHIVHHCVIYKKIARCKKPLEVLVLQGLPTDPNKLSASHALGGNSNDNSSMSKGALLNISDVSCHCIYPSQTCINLNVGELEQTSLSYKRCGRNASSTPSQGPETLRCQGQDAATDGMTFGHNMSLLDPSGNASIIIMANTCVHDS
ncbi:hypothetical protein NC652_009001 [Populus alba x Populus x berolinensis]|nr:hypothetical protein NC652_009001 [Populus alba x Populus x berolinensis]